MQQTVQKEHERIENILRKKFDLWYKKTKKNGTETEPLNHKEAKECMDCIYSAQTRKSQTFEKKYVSRTINYYLNSNVKRYSDDEFIELLENSNEKKCYVLIEPPGIGKTTFVEYVGFEVQKSKATEVHIVYLTDKSENSESFLSDLQRKLSYNGNKTLVIIDGFEKLDQASQDPTIDTIKDLINKYNVQIIITGRSQVQAKLEDKLKVITMNLLPLNFSEQVQFLGRYWDVTDEKKTQFDEFSNELLNVFRSRVGRTDQPDFFAFPLTIRMLAEFYSADFEALLNAAINHVEPVYFSNIIENFNILKVYEQFVDVSCFIWKKQTYNEKAYLDINKTKIENDKKKFRPLYDAFITIHQWAALKFLNLNKLVKKFEAKNKKENIQAYLDEFKQHSVLINVFSTGEFEFVDQSYAEYFVAKFIFDNKLKSNRTLDQHAIVRVFHKLMCDRKNTPHTTNFGYWRNMVTNFRVNRLNYGRLRFNN